MDKDEIQSLLERGYAKALADAPSWIQEAWTGYGLLSVMDRVKVPFLYYVLGQGTLQFKAPPRLALYMPISPIKGFSCSNCPYAYEKVAGRGHFICSQIRGVIEPEGWCVIPHTRPKETGWPELTAEQISFLAAMA